MANPKKRSRANEFVAVKLFKLLAQKARAVSGYKTHMILFADFSTFDFSFLMPS